MTDNEEIALTTIRCVEQRNLERLHELYHPDVAFHWQPGLPYSGDFSGSKMAAMTETFAEVWGPLQPDDATRRMDPRVVASHGDLVIVEYTWRARRPDGATFETETLAKYRFKDSRLIDARMFYFDLEGLIAFIEHDRR